MDPLVFFLLQLFRRPVSYDIYLQLGDLLLYPFCNGDKTHCSLIIFISAHLSQKAQGIWLCSCFQICGFYPFAFGHSTLCHLIPSHLILSCFILCHVIPNHVVFDPIIRIQYLTVLYMILFFDQPLILLVKSKNPVCFFTVFSFFFQS